MTGRKVLPRVAMTGEVTLRGHVLMIGGLKEKLLAARMAQVEKVCWYRRKNQPDVKELSKGNHERNGDRIHQGDERSHPRGICTGEIAV
ncbi:MAG: S16 family serine protease [Clostridium fessum]